MKKTSLVCVLAFCLSLLFSSTWATERNSKDFCSREQKEVSILTVYDPVASTHDRKILPGYGSSNRRQESTMAKRGCCSHHKGVCGCKKGKVQCCDGTESPTCRCASNY